MIQVSDLNKTRFRYESDVAMRMREVLARQAVHANVVGGGPATKHIQISRKKVEKQCNLKSQPSPLMDGANYLIFQKEFPVSLCEW